MYDKRNEIVHGGEDTTLEAIRCSLPITLVYKGVFGKIGHQPCTEKASNYLNPVSEIQTKHVKINQGINPRKNT